jgi:hypothetical protein
MQNSRAVFEHTKAEKIPFRAFKRKSSLESFSRSDLRS